MARPEPNRRSQRGHLLILLMAGLTVMLIMLTVAGQSWTFQMRREMELELIFRGEQYVNGLSFFRKANGNAFPVGDLKVLAQRNPTGIRFMRKLYKNPMDPNGKWQYLYLHPGGTGFINPCAVGGGIGFNDPRGNPQLAGQVPVSGFGGGLSGGGRTTGRGINGDVRTTGFADPYSDENPELPTGANAAKLSAIDPKTFKATGMQKMNLPIVGVVNCEMEESIRTYKGQTWLSNWAFTPLAQGEFGGNAQGGGRGSARSFAGGVGEHGNEVYTDSRNPKYQKSSGVRGVFAGDEEKNPWRREPPNSPPGDQGYASGSSDPDHPERDPSRRPDPNSPARPPSHPQDPNHPSRPPDPNQPPQDPNQTFEDPNDEGGYDEDEDDEGYDSDDDEGDDEDPNAPADPNGG